jgi:hypothetical protein
MHERLLRLKTATPVANADTGKILLLRINTFTRNVVVVVCVIAALVNANVLDLSLAKDAKELPALMTALAMVFV